MDHRSTDIYFETSAINFLFKDFQFADAIATKALQDAKGNKWHISPVSLWEMMLVSDETERSRMLQLAQHTFHESLLKSPSEIIIDFLNDPENKQRKSIYSGSDLAKTWTNICRNPFTELQWDVEVFKKYSGQFKKYSRYVNVLVNAFVFDLVITNDSIKSLNVIITACYQAVVNEEFLSDDQKKIARINILLLFVIMCLGMDITPEIIENFWKEKNVKDKYERFTYLVEHYNFIITGLGPLHFLSFMVYSQITRKKSRGLLHDALHCLYIPFVDIFFTNDADFKNYKALQFSPVLERICHLENTEMTKKKTWVDYEPIR